jgi:hypothetical protein
VRYEAETNAIAVRVDAPHIATDGIHADPVRKNGRWTLTVTADVESSADAARRQGRTGSLRVTRRPTTCGS